MYEILHAFRVLKRNPLFAVFAVLTLAIGIGMNTAVYTIADALLLRPLAVYKPEELIRLYQHSTDGSVQQRFSYPDYEDIRDRNHSLSGIAGVALVPFQLETGSDRSQILGEAVTSNYFSVLNVAPLKGTLAFSDDGAAVAVISEQAWKQKFGADPEIVHRSLRLNGKVYEIAGVMNQDFGGTFAGARIDVWIPLTSNPSLLGFNWQSDREKSAMQLIARLKSGIKVDQARAELNAIAAHLEKPERIREIQIGPATLLHGQLRKSASIFFVAIGGLMALVLLITCSNLAGLLLTKAMQRRREMAIRFSLGANRSQIATQLIVENLIVAFAGGCLGFFAALWSADLLVSFWPIPTVPIQIVIHPNWKLFGFAFSTSLLSAVLLAFSSVLYSTRRDVMSMLKEEMGTSSVQKHRLKNSLLVAQITFSMLLLICAGLFVRSWANARSMDLGFNSNQLLAMDISLSNLGYPESKGRQYFDQLQSRIQQLPGVVSVALSDLAPVDLATPSTPASIAGYQPPRGRNSLLISSNRVSTGYFHALELPLTAGREFTQQDDENAPAVAIINQTMARLYWPGENPIGKHFQAGRPLRDVTVIGIAKDIKYRTPGEGPTAHMYLCSRQFYEPGMTVLIRARQNPKTLWKPVSRQMSALDADVQAFFVRTMEEHLAFALLPTKLGGSLLGVFGLIALLLASIGIYGAVSFHVAQRTREIGIRMAIGARPSAILNHFAAHGLRLSIRGSILGIVAAFAVTRLLSSLLIGIDADDALTFVVVPSLLILISLAACAVPAYRASKLDPLRALRYE